MVCKQCGRCCSEIWLRITNPMSIEERMVFLWKGGRFEGDIVKFTATCKFLTPECKCLIYEDRPQYCKDYYCKESK